MSGVVVIGIEWAMGVILRMLWLGMSYSYSSFSQKANDPVPVAIMIRRLKHLLREKAIPV